MTYRLLAIAQYSGGSVLGAAAMEYRTMHSVRSGRDVRKDTDVDGR